MALLTVKIARRTVEAESIVALELQDVTGGELPSFDAGAHIDVHLADGLVRQYSLCSPPWERYRYLIGVLRDPQSRGGSRAVHERLAVGDQLKISAPRNMFPLVPTRRTLLLAGGIGITPLLCMAESLAAVGADFELHYCARSPQVCAFRERISQSAFGHRTRIHFDDGDASQKLDLPRLLASKDPDCRMYICGPSGFIEYVRGVAASSGWPATHVHFEYFGARPCDATTDGSFEVQVASTGCVYQVPADQSVVDALAAHGVSVPVSCEAGVCGTCVVKVLEGVPDHRDAYLTDEEKSSNRMFTPCCSRAASHRLVLDL